MSGKNSADIRMVVDALDLCYSKQHIDVFALISGDSDFSPLVSKLKENNKRVLGCGVKSSTSDLLIANCDEFIYYDDLIRVAKRTQSKAAPKKEGTPHRKRTKSKRRRTACWKWSIRSSRITTRLWGSLLKQAIRRVFPGFNEGYYGYRQLFRPAGRHQDQGADRFGIRRKPRQLQSRIDEGERRRRTAKRRKRRNRRQRQHLEKKKTNRRGNLETRRKRRRREGSGLRNDGRSASGRRGCRASRAKVFLLLQRLRRKVSRRSGPLLRVRRRFIRFKLLRTMPQIGPRPWPRARNTLARCIRRSCAMRPVRARSAAWRWNRWCRRPKKRRIPNSSI